MEVSSTLCSKLQCPCTLRLIAAVSICEIPKGPPETGHAYETDHDCRRSKVHSHKRARGIVSIHTVVSNVKVLDSSHGTKCLVLVAVLLTVLYPQSRRRLHISSNASPGSTFSPSVLAVMYSTYAAVREMLSSIYTNN